MIVGVARATGASKTEPLEGSVRAHLADRDGLVLLDNAEHVLGDAADAVRLVAGAGPRLRVLATSRQPLGVDGEVVVDVEPLASDDAVALFRERAADAGCPVPEAEDVAGLCDRLDRLPLAIEMAAARLRGLPLRTLVTRLDDRLRLLQRREGGDPRYRTLWEVVDWSYGLLDDDHRELFAQLSVFAGGFTLEAAEAVCAIQGSVDATVSDLVDRSLVRVDPHTGRYRMLDTIRAYAVERRGPDHPVLGRHVAYHVGLAERIGQGLSGPDDTAWAARFDADGADIEAAHRRARSGGDADAVARISAALYGLVYQRLCADVGVWAEAGLRVVVDAGHPLEPTVRAVVAVNLVNRDDIDAAAELLADLPDQPAARHAHEVLADLSLYRGNLAAALDHARRQEDLARRAGDQFSATFALAAQAVAHCYDGRHADGLAVAGRGAAAADTPLLAAWFDYITAELCANDEPTEALTLLEQVIDQATDAGWEFLLGAALLTAGTVLARHADPDEALAVFRPPDPPLATAPRRHPPVDHAAQPRRPTRPRGRTRARRDAAGRRVTDADAHLRRRAAPPAHRGRGAARHARPRAVRGSSHVGKTAAPTRRRGAGAGGRRAADVICVPAWAPLRSPRVSQRHPRRRRTSRCRYDPTSAADELRHGRVRTSHRAAHHHGARALDVPPSYPCLVGLGRVPRHVRRLG